MYCYILFKIIIYFVFIECDGLVDTKIIRFKHSGVQQEILDQLLSKGWRSLINPSLVFNQCLQTNLKPFFWDKSEDYNNYTLVINQNLY